jgi:CBS domain-containing protein/sporulation protein YlmC with PRC-barrel domain
VVHLRCALLKLDQGKIHGGIRLPFPGEGLFHLDFAMQDTITDAYLSSVLGRTVINERGAILGKLWDLVLIPGDVLPLVSHLLIKQRQTTLSLAWQDVALFNRFVITARNQARLDDHSFCDTEILVKRDILDKQIVDVNGAKVVRVNDLKIGVSNGRLGILTVDIGFRGLLRRLGYERFGERCASLLRKELVTQEMSWQYVQPLEQNVSRLALTMVREQLAEMHPADLAEIISQLPSQNIQTVINSLDMETAGEAIHELEPELRTRVISQLDSEQASDILEEMAPDEAADVLGDLPEEKAQELLRLMDEEEAEDLQELMVHKDDSAGGLMNTEYLAISSDLTVDEALHQVRLLAPDVETVYYLYVMEESERVVGVVTLKDLLTNPLQTPILEIMTSNLKTVAVDASPEEVLEIIAKYNLIAIPVLGEGGEMLGIVTVDDILEMFLPYALRRRRHHH